MEDLVLSIEQCKHLQELGLDMSDAKFSIFRHIESNFNFVFPSNVYCDALEHIIYTYTLQEILDTLPFEVSDEKYRYEPFIDYSHDTVFYYNFTTHKELHSEQSESHNILDSAYEMLCWVIENGHLKVK